MKRALRRFAVNAGFWLLLGVLVFAATVAATDATGGALPTLDTVARAGVAYTALCAVAGVLAAIRPDLATNKPDTATATDRQTPAREDLAEWSNTAAHLFYCELCGQVFPTFAIFNDHREASDAERARAGDEEFHDYRELRAGDPLPDGATVGTLAPCELTDYEGDSS